MKCEFCDAPESKERMCFPNYPQALQKACHDPFDYLLKLKNGDVFFFSEACQHGEEFAHITIQSRDRCANMCEESDWYEALNSDRAFERGVEIRVSEIAWIADAPHGS